MATIVQQHRGTTAQHATYVGPEGSITVDIDKDVVVVHDGETAGGHPLASDKNVVHTVGDENVAGIKTFSASPQVPSVDAFDVSTNASSTKQVDDALQTMVVRVDTLPTDAAELAALKAKLRNNAAVWVMGETSSGGSVDEIMDLIQRAQQTADAANTAAGNAQNAATAAQTAAGQAQQTANAANTAAGQAQTTANAASDGLANKLDTTGTAAAATKLATARTISLSGDATGSASFDGTANAAITTTLANSGVTAGSYGPSANASPAHQGTFTVPQVTVDAKGRVTSAVNRTITLPSDNAGSSITLNNTVTSTSTTQAATANAVKTAYDMATSKWTAVNASTSQKGIVQLSSSTSSTSTTTAATSSAVKAAYDRATTAINNASSAGFPSGTQMLFAQSAAPTGWTKQTTVNDAAIRVVSGTTGGGTGGSVAFATAFASKTVSISGTSGATTLTVAQMPSHGHSYAKLEAPGTTWGEGATQFKEATGTTGTKGSSSSHTHSFSGSSTVNLAVKYLDVIVCKKA